MTEATHPADAGHPHVTASAQPHAPAPAADAIDPHADASMTEAAHPADPYADVYAELEHADGRRKSSAWLLVALFVLIAVLAAAAVFLFLRFGMPGGTTGDGNVPVIQAPDTPQKVKPQDAGDAAAPVQPRRRKLIYDRITDEEAGSKPAAPPANAPQPPAATPTPAPPPLPPPPSLGDDQGKTEPPSPPSGGQGVEDAARTAQGGSVQGGNRQDAGARLALRAGGSELSAAVRAFVGTGDAGRAHAGSEARAMNGGDDASVVNTAAALRAGASELAAATRAFSGNAATTDKATGGGKAAKAIAATGIAAAPATASTLRLRDARETRTANATAARKATQRNGRAAERTRRPATERARRNIAARSTATTPPRKPQPKARRVAAARNAAAAARPAAPTPRAAPTPARPASGGPIPLPGAIPGAAAARPLPVSPVPAGRRNVAAAPAAVDARPLPSPSTPPAAAQPPRKRMNFNTARTAASATAPAAATRLAAAPATPATPPARPRQAAPTRVASAPRRAIATPPAKRPAPQARANAGGYVVQLAAYRSQQDAQRAWARVRAKHGGLLGGMQPIISRKDLGAAGTFYRLSVGPVPSRQAANRLCQRLIARGEPDCLIRKR